MKIARIDTRRDDVSAALDALREKLSPRGDIVSEAGRKRTIQVFGEPLSPQPVVERICRDVRTKGLPALLDYTAKLDKATISAGNLRISSDELKAAHAAADPQLLATVRQVRDNIREFQQAILHRDVEVKRDGVT